MRTLLCMLAAFVAVSAVGGCAQENMAKYVPLGPSAEWDALPSLVLALPVELVYWESPDPQTRKQPEDVHQELYASVQKTIGSRPTRPGFRCLLALVNRHFGEWERLVVVERVRYDEYGFVVVAQTSDGLKAVTNLRCRSRGQEEGRWEEGHAPRRLRFDAAKFGACLVELDKVRTALPESLVWFGDDSGTLYALHDIRPDGPAFYFGVHRFPPRVVMHLDDEAPLPKPPFDFPKDAGAARERARMPSLADSPEAKDAYALASKYVAVLAMVWENTLGLVDARLLEEW